MPAFYDNRNVNSATLSEIQLKAKMTKQAKKEISKIYNGLVWVSIPVIVGTLLTLSPLLSGESYSMRLVFFAAIAISYGFGIRAIATGIRNLIKQRPIQENTVNVESKIEETSASKIRPTHTENIDDSKLNAVLPVIVSDKTLFVVMDAQLQHAIETEDFQRYQNLLQSTGLLRQQGYDIRFIRPIEGTAFASNPLTKPSQIFFSESNKFPNLWISPN